MCKFKIGIRKNLRYPLMLIVFIALRKLVELLMNRICDYSNGFFICPLLIFVSQFLAGFIHILFNNCKVKKNSQKIKKYSVIELIQNKIELIQSDNQIKIFILIILASYFNYFSIINRRGKIHPFHFENRIRCIQIVFSGLLCYFTIRTKIFRHQLFSLIIIFVIVIITIAIDFCFEGSRYDLLIFYSSGIFSCFLRAFLDTIEKYLFEFDYLDPYKILMSEGLIGCLLLPFLLFLDKTYEDINDIFENTNWQLLIFILFIYFILNSFENIYRVLTIKSYSPMTRALAETIIDPIIFIYSSYKEINEKKYLILILIFLLITTFLSLVYNDFIVFYCCGFEYDTHLEIQKRAILNENINGSIMDLEINNSFEEEDNNEKTELSVQ